MVRGYFICENCRCHIEEGMEQHDEEGRLICPVCSLHGADEREFQVPSRK